MVQCSLRDMNSVPPQASSSASEATTSVEARSAAAMVKIFLLENEPAFRRLDELRAKVSGLSGQISSKHK